MAQLLLQPNAIFFALFETILAIILFCPKLRQQGKRCSRLIVSLLGRTNPNWELFPTGSPASFASRWRSG